MHKRRDKKLGKKKRGFVKAERIFTDVEEYLV